VNLLLDTHALLWFLTNDPKLSERAKSAIESSSNNCFVSAGSLWEIAIKISLGKLKLPFPYGEIFPRQLDINGFSLLPITPQHCDVLMALPFYHRAPFDRLLLAQAQSDSLILVTDDGQFASYLIPTIW